MYPKNTSQSASFSNKVYSPKGCAGAELCIIAWYGDQDRVISSPVETYPNVPKCTQIHQYLNGGSSAAFAVSLDIASLYKRIV